MGIILENEEILDISANLQRDFLKGDKGDTGKDGQDGADGKSAYQIWLDEGNSGTEQDFLESLKGKDGADGINGVNGKDGVNGTNGQDGYTPVKGIDYWTEDDITSIETYCSNYINAQITQAIGGAY